MLLIDRSVAIANKIASAKIQSVENYLRWAVSGKGRELVRELVRAASPVSHGKPPGKQEREREDVQEKEVCWEWEPSLQHSAQLQVRIIPAETGNARVPVRLSCHIWGFYPPEVTVFWLHNGDIVEPDDYNPISAIPNGDWSYQTQVSLLVAPVAGDTYTCSVQHVSLQEPLLEDWSEWRGAGPQPEAGGLGSLLPLTRPCPRRFRTDAGGDDSGGGGHCADGAGTWLLYPRRLPLQGQASSPG
uniref:Ig-like domain-containing protein n=1 Tax=Anas platyrhynchos platyrhynchos TaxID=8840 RepID=A0A493T783_ANAPP